MCHGHGYIPSPIQVGALSVTVCCTEVWYDSQSVDSQSMNIYVKGISPKCIVSWADVQKIRATLICMLIYFKRSMKYKVNGILTKFSVAIALIAWGCGWESSPCQWWWKKKNQTLTSCYLISLTVIGLDFESQLLALLRWLKFWRTEILIFPGFKQ